jgi:predicted amidophosphoribosyltransferase
MGGAGLLHELYGSPACVGCGLAGGPLCRDCRPPPARGLTPQCPPAGRVIAVWDYAGTARSLVLDLKLRGKKAAATPLVEGLCRSARRNGVVAEAVTWIPGGRQGVRRRGFDHAAVLAQGVGAGLGLPVTGMLWATVPRRDQATLGAAERQRNQRGALAANPCRGHWLLIDDVITTGASARAGAAALRAAGAAGVEVLVACRA